MRENSVSTKRYNLNNYLLQNGYKHVLIAAKLNEKALGKKPLEPVLREFYEGIRDPEEDENRAKSFTQRVDGLCFIANHMYIHFMEFDEDKYFDLVMKSLHDSCGKGIHEDVWVLHFTEEEPERMMTEWVVKQINTGQCSKEIKSLTQYDKVNDILYNISHIQREA